MSSLGLCTASWLFPVHGNAAYAVPVQPPENPDAIREQIAEEALYRFYNPLASLEHAKLLKQSDKPMKYKIKPGDTLSEIAKRFDLTTLQLADFNQIQNIHAIRAGHALKIPYREEQIRIREERDLASLAEQYNVSEGLMKRFNPELAQTGGLYVGQVVSVPKRIKVQRLSPKQKKPHGGQNSVQLASRPANEESARFSGSFSWPVGGQLTSGFGNRNGRLHRGIDIWNEQEGNTPIKAAAPGVVSRAGHAGGYGNLVVIDHGDGWSTYYAHLRVMNVSRGQSVSSGEVIGYMGKSGNSTGYHLHFEVRKNGENLDPMSVLP